MKQNQTQPTKRLLKVKDAAIYLSISPWKLRRLVQDGALSFIQDREFGPWLIDVRDLDSYIERMKKTAF